MSHPVRSRVRALCGVLAAVGLSACGGGGGSAQDTRQTALARGELPYGATVPATDCARGEQIAGGRSYRVEIPSRVDGEPVVFQVLEPSRIDCVGGHPLILEGHGYSGSRQTGRGGGSPLSFGAPIGQLNESGYVVISIDQRGHGESGGTIRTMDPEFEGQDLIAIVDWAEQHLDYLARRNGNLLLGAIGGSYGGGYQMLLLAVDPDQRLDAIVPEITWHDLSYSLAPNGVPKSFWGLFLSGAGEANTGLAPDPFIRSVLVEAAVTGEFRDDARAFFNYHSPSYHCDNPLGIALGQPGDTAGFFVDPLLSLLPLTADGRFVVQTPRRNPYPRVDALIFQGPRDDLFNLNEAYANYRCLQRGGGDVRLMSYPSGHHVLRPALGLALEAVLAQNLPIERTCGDIDADAATLAWFNEKLRGVGRADDVIRTGRDLCLSLTTGDAIQVSEMLVGGTEFPIALPGGLPVTVAAGPAGAVPVLVPLTAVSPGINAIAGIPTATITLSRGAAALDAACTDAATGLTLLTPGSCDAIVYVGVGVLRPNLPVPDLLEDQVFPLKGIGRHEVELVGVAERLRTGDQLFLMLYGLHPSFVATLNRDPLTPVVTVSGSVRLPLLQADNLVGN